MSWANTMVCYVGWLTLAMGFALVVPVRAATTVPTDVQLPGTQPGRGCDRVGDEMRQLPRQLRESRSAARGALVQLGRKHDGPGRPRPVVSGQPWPWPSRISTGPVTSACAATWAKGWLDGRSTPTDGSALAQGDADGVQCDLCHTLTRPDGTEHAGVQNAPFLAHDGGNPAEPIPREFDVRAVGRQRQAWPVFLDPAARHQAAQSNFHRLRRSLRYLPRCLESSGRRPGP